MTLIAMKGGLARLGHRRRKHRWQLRGAKQLSAVRSAKAPVAAETARKSSQSRPNAVPKSSQCRPKVVPKSFQDRPKVVPKSSQSRPKIVPMSSQCRPKVVPMSSPSRPKAVPRSSQSRPNVVPMSSQGHPKVVPKSSKVGSRSSQCRSNAAQMRILDRKLDPAFIRHSSGTNLVKSEGRRTRF